MLGIQKADGTPYFHIEYLMDYVFKLSPEEKEENKKYWVKYGAGGGVGPEGGGEGGEGGGIPEAGGGPEGAAPAGEAQGGGESPTPEAGGSEVGGGTPPESPAPEGGSSEFEF